MAPTLNHENAALGSRLLTAADAIVNHAASNLERDLRDAGRILVAGAASGPVTISDMIGELNRIANDTQDPVTRERLRRLLGGA